MDGWLSRDRTTLDVVSKCMKRVKDLLTANTNILPIMIDQYRKVLSFACWRP